MSQFVRGSKVQTNILLSPQILTTNITTYSDSMQSEKDKD